MPHRQHLSPGVRRSALPSSTVTALFYCCISLLALSRQCRHLTDKQSCDQEVISILWTKAGTNSSEALLEAKAIGGEVLGGVMSTRSGTFILLNVVMSGMAASALLTKTVFLGQLTVIETAKLADRMLRFILLKVVFLGAVVSPHPADVAAYLLWAFTTGFMKAFVGLARDRGDALLSSPNATLWQHLRCSALLLCMLANDAAWIAAGIRLAGATPLSWALLWLFDAACVGVEGLHAGIRYVVQGLDRWRSYCSSDQNQDDNSCSTPLSEAHAESRSQFLYSLDLCADLALHALNLAHYAHILRLRGGLKMQLIDLALLTDVKFLIVAAWRRGQGHVQYRRLTHKLRYCFPDAAPEDLAQPGGVTCAICMENMKSSAKVLPCSHMYHLACLREWLQQGAGIAFTCPMCRANLMVEDAPQPHRTANNGTERTVLYPFASSASSIGRTRRSRLRRRPRRERRHTGAAGAAQHSDRAMQLGECDCDDWRHRGGDWESSGPCVAVLNGDSEYEDEEEEEVVEWHGGEERRRLCSCQGGCTYDCSAPGDCVNRVASERNEPTSALGTLRWDKDVVERGEEEEESRGRKGCGQQCGGVCEQSLSRRVTRSMRSI